jgi:hypothetical protein
VRVNESINALVELLDDPDEVVATHVQSKIVEHGEEIIPQLEKLQDRFLDNPHKSERIEHMIHNIQFEVLKKALSNWMQSEEKNLLEGVYLICKYQYPDLKISALNDRLLEIKQAVWLEINPKQTSFETIKVFNRIFFDHFDFKCSDVIQHSPFDYFVNSVLETREGSDTALGLIYSLVAQSLDLPIYGVSVDQPNKTFLLAYLDKNNILEILDWGVHNNGVLFYISISNKGIVVDPQRLEEAFKIKGLPISKDQFEPTPNTILIKNYLIQISKSCENLPYFRYKLGELNELINLFKK